MTDNPTKPYHELFIKSAASRNVPVGAVYAYCRDKGACYQHAVDIAEESSQEAYMRSAVYSFESQVHFDRWVTRTAIHCAVNRKRVERRELPSDELQELPAVDSSMQDDAKETYKLRRRALDIALGSLSLLEKGIFLMWYNEHTLDEIAVKYLSDYSGSEVARRLRARRIRLEAQEKMKKALEDNGINPQDIFGA